MKKFFRRSEDDIAIGGVCSGLAKFYKWDLVGIRVIWTLLSMPFPIMVLVYIILWAVVPIESNNEDTNEIT